MAQAVVGMRFEFVGDEPFPEDRKKLEELLGLLGDRALQPGAAFALPRGEGAPPEHWFVNRVVWDQDQENWGYARATLIMDRGFPLTSITKGQVQEEVQRLVAGLSAKALTPQGQVQHLTAFVVELMKGRVYAGA